MNSKKQLLAATIGFLMGGSGVSQGVLAQEESSEGWTLEEIVVTANKRNSGQSIQDTAMSISAFSQETIDKRGFLELSDYARTIPGLSVADTGVGLKRVYVRGLSLLDGNRSTVGAYLGEMPLSTVSEGAVDLRLVDIERLEVLKGPQGTLYGSSALAGTLRYIPVAPNLQDVEGNISVDLATLDESDDINQGYTGAFNLPLIEDQLALRVVAYHFEDAGWIDVTNTPEGEFFGGADNPATVESVSAETGVPVKLEEDANSVTTTGFRANLLWRPNNQLDINLLLGTQEQEGGGEQAVFFERGDFTQSTLNTGPNGKTNDTDYANLVIGYDFGWARLISSTSQLETNRKFSRSFFSSIPNALFGAMQTGNGSGEDAETFVQELRLASQFDGDFQFVTGVLYEDHETTKPGVWNWVGDADAIPARLGGETVAVSNIRTIDYQQKALFGELSYQFNDYVELTVGGRHFDYEREDSGTQGSAPLDGKVLTLNTDEKGEVFKANVSYTPNDDALFYAQIAEGFRLGKGQALPLASDCDVNNDGFVDHTGGRLTPELESDTTENIELGAKFSLLDNRLALNAAVYQIDWTGLPLGFRGTTSNCNSLILNNAGEARSEGAEVELSYLLTDAFKMDFAFAYNEAELTSVTAGSGLEVGEKVPFAPKVTANLGLEYSFDLSEYPAFVRADINHFGEINLFGQAAIDSFNLPSGGDFTQYGLRAGVTIEQWDLAFYGQNLTNEDNVTWLRSIGTRAVGRLKPRKIGFQVNYNF